MTAKKKVLKMSIMSFSVLQLSQTAEIISFDISELMISSPSTLREFP